LSADRFLADFLGDSTCLIVEPSPAFSSSVQICLRELGIQPGQVIVARKFEEAMNIIKDRKPKMLITEYQIEQNFGLSLVESQEQFHDSQSRLSAIVTKNSSDSAIAEAAEDQVDLFILKPVSPETFKQKVTDAIMRKLNPSSYQKKIQKGRQHFDAKELEVALQEFNDAKPLDSKPTLAFFYSGQTQLLKGLKLEALAEFRQGRKLQPLHYKCLIGEFDVLIEEKRYDEAYAIVPLINDNYPITSRRLGQIITAAVYTKHFEELSVYYEKFKNLEYRTNQLVSITALAFLTAGRFALADKDLKKALEYYEFASLSSARIIEMIEKIILDLKKVNAINEAQVFLSKVHQSQVGSPTYNQLSFQIDIALLSNDQLLEKGRKLVAAKQCSPEIFKTLVSLAVKMDKMTLAETFISQAVPLYPDLRGPLYLILQSKAATAT
jgi:DNA-binding response OmpR family regulator